MPTDESDSGIDAPSMPDSREESPQTNEPTSKPSLLSLEEADDDLEETVGERLWGLTEMFPEGLRNGLCGVSNASMSTVKWTYSFGRSAFWVFFSSATILVAPIIFEMERLQMDEMQKQQQRQILLGPSAAMSGGVGPMPGMPPPR